MIKTISLKDKWFSILLLLLIFLLPLGITSDYTLHIFILTFMWVALASGLNILLGFGGQLSIGHAAFFGIGAYTSSLLWVNFGIIPWIGMLIGGILSMAAAAIISAPALRLKGPFFVLTTIAFAEVIRIIATHFRGLTRGSVGLSVPFEPGFINMAFREREIYYYLFLAFMLLVVFLSYKIQSSKLGYYLAGVKGDVDAAESLGVPTTKVKLIAMLVSAFIVSIGGSMYAQYLFYIDPSTVLIILLSIQMVLICAIGGIGIWQGPILGGFLVIPFGEYLRAQLGGQYRGLHEALFGLILVLVVVFIPNGLFPFVRDITRKVIDRFFTKEREINDIGEKEV